MATTVTSKGQVTIPKLLRDHLGIKPGSKVEFDLAPDGRIVVAKVDDAPVPAPKGRFERFRGRYRSGMTTDEIMALTRGD